MKIACRNSINHAVILNLCSTVNMFSLCKVLKCIALLSLCMHFKFRRDKATQPVMLQFSSFG